MCAYKLLLSDKDMEYGKALARAVSNLHNEFEISTQKMNDKLITKDYDLLIIGGYSEETILNMMDDHPVREHIVILSDIRTGNLMNQAENPDHRFWYIYKYQNINSIISDINFVLGTVTGKKNHIRNSTVSDLIGFFSIGGGTGQTAIAIGTARELSRYHEKKVLYLSFEEFPATKLYIAIDSENRTITDYLYYLLERRNEALCLNLEAFTLSDEYGVETFSPSAGRNDLNLLDLEELTYVMKIISDSCRYDYILLDLKKELSEDTMQMMNLCSRLILIQNDNPISKHKSEMLVTYLSRISLANRHDDFILITNRSGEQETCEDNSKNILRKNIKLIKIEKDENSFRFINNRMNLDIGHTFGLGIKKIAEEILLTEASRRRSSNISDHKNT